METLMSKGWLIVAALGLLLSAGLAGAAESDPLADYVSYADAQVTDELQVAQVSGERESAVVAEAEPVGNSAAEAGDTREKIMVSFEETDEDILTRQAVEKLDVIVESLEFANADLKNVIRLIGERLNINFIFDANDISGKITLRLQNVRLRDALNSILTTRRLAMVADRSGIFRIVPQAQVGMTEVETRTEVLTLNWVNAEDVLETMKPFLTQDVGEMQFNEESNKLIVTDVPPQIETIKRLLNEIDIPERQVMIEARLADVDIGAAREFSTNWSASKINADAITRRTTRERETTDFLSADGSSGSGYVRDIHGDIVTDDDGVPLTQELATILETTNEEIWLGGSRRIGETTTVNDIMGLTGTNYIAQHNPIASVAQVLYEGLDVSAGKGTLSLGEQIHVLGNTYNLDMVFTALEQRDIVEILSNPRVTTLNNIPATIRMIQRIPYVTEQGTEAGTAEQIKFENAGVEIMVKPIITPNGFIRMQIDLKQDIFRTRVGGGALDPPAIDERFAQTNVIVPDGSTSVLGGLRKLRKLENTDAIPWLHRIPLIGWLFKDEITDQVKTELVLMMTPRIIRGEQDLTERERFWYDRIDTQWHLPDYFYDDVSQVTDKDKSEPME